MDVDIPDDGERIEYEFDEEAEPPVTGAKTPSVAYYVKRMLIVLLLGYALVRAFNAFVVPLADAVKEQRAVLKAHTVNYENKCLDARVKASYQGYDGCLEHEAVIASGLYYPALKLYARKLDPCGDKGCLSIEMNAVSWLAFVLPLGLGVGTLTAVLILALIVIGVHRTLSARYEFPDRMPAYAKTRWTPPPARARQRRPTLDAPQCAK